jgi:hypothetical protein
MQPHELKPLRKRLSPAQLASRAKRIEMRLTTPRYRPPVFIPVSTAIGFGKLTNPADMAFYSMLGLGLGIRRRR